MLKTLIQKLLLSARHQKTLEEIKNSTDPYKIAPVDDIKLTYGQIEIIKWPGLKNQKEFTLTQLHVKTGDMVKSGDILCSIENKELLMEFESFCSGRIIWCCSENTHISTGMEICKIEGV